MISAPKQTTRARFRLLPAVALSAALGGCFLNPDAMPPNKTRDIDQLYHSLMRLQPAIVEPQVETITMLHKVDFGFGEDGLSEGESDRLLKFILQSGADDRSRISIDGPRKAGGQFDILTRARIAAIESNLLEAGVETSVSPRPVDSLSKPHDAVIVTVTRAMIIEPDCEVPKTIYGPRPTHVWSCSSAVALGRMVEDPRDLERGRALDDADAETLAAGIERYRTDKVKQLEAVSTAGE